jgi:hypothetical protein
MALSVQKNPYGPAWGLGAIVVPTPGTPVNIMSLVDSGNVNAPETPIGPGTQAGGEYTPAAHKIFYQGVHPGAGNNGMVYNTGMAYLCVKGAGGAGNRADSGSILAVIPPGGAGSWPAGEQERNTISPYKFYIDVDSANDGALLSLAID